MKRKILIISVVSAIAITMVGCSSQKSSSSGVDNNNDINSSQTIETSIDSKKAEKIALEKTGSGNIDDIVLNDQNIFEIKLSDDKFNYSVNISKSDGKIVSYEKVPLSEGDNTNTTANNANTQLQNQQPQNQQPVANGNNNISNNNQNNINNNPSISKADAEKIALGKTGGGRIISSELDFDDGIYKYEFEIINNNVEYDISIDGNTGNIIKYESDSERFF